MEVDDAVSLIEVVRDPLSRDFEAQQLESDGHVHVYRYVAEEAHFLCATIASGAAAPVFRVLSGDDTVPVEGWIPLADKPPGRPRLVRGG